MCAREDTSLELEQSNQKHSHTDAKVRKRQSRGQKREIHMYLHGHKREKADKCMRPKNKNCYAHSFELIQAYATAKNQRGKVLCEYNDKNSVSNSKTETIVRIREKKDVFTW